MDAMTWLRTNWDRVLGSALVILGASLLVIGTVQVSQARLLADSLSYLMSAGLGGLGCLAVGAALLVTAALHDEWQKLDRIEASLREDTQLRQASSVIDVYERFGNEKNVSPSGKGSNSATADLTSAVDRDTWPVEPAGRGRRKGA
jgi:hypothetical protein